MEGVGARLGRSSTRYGPATVFTGPVRKWKKKWIHVTPSAAPTDKHHHSNGNSSSNGNNNDASHIMLYKWTPIRKSHNTSTDDNSNGDTDADAKDDDDSAAEEPPRRKMRYIPIALLEEQDNEVQTDEAKPVEDDSIADMNDVPGEDNNEVCESIEKQDDNKSSVGLSLNLNAPDDDNDDEQLK